MDNSDENVALFPFLFPFIRIYSHYLEAGNAIVVSSTT